MAIKDISQAEFAERVLQSPRPVVVDVWAPWCGPCRTMAPELKAADKQLGGQVQFLKVNIDENLRLLFRYMIVGIPTLLFFSHGRLVDRKAGKQNADAIIKRAEPLLTMDEQLAAKRAMKGWFRWPF